MFLKVFLEVIETDLWQVGLGGKLFVERVLVPIGCYRFSPGMRDVASSFLCSSLAI